MKTSPWTWLIGNIKVAVLAGVILCVWGILSFVSIPKESAPYIPFGVVNISTVYNGVAAEDMDSLVTQKIENKIKSVSNIKQIDSVSRNSLSNITVEFEPDTNMIKALSDLRSKVDEAKPELPNDLESDPNILEIDSSIDPFFSIVLSGKYSNIELRDFAEDLKLFLESIPNVADVSIDGGAEREIAVKIDPIKLQSYGISSGEVIAAIRNSHRDTPIGGFDIGTEEYNVRFQGKHRSADDVRSVHVKNLSQNGNISVITVGDVASVEETADSNADSIRRIGFRESGKIENAISIQVSKSTGKNIFDVDKLTREKTNEYAEANLPADLNITFEREAVKPAQESFDNVYNSGAQAIGIVMLILFVFIGLRAGLVASLVIPITFLITIGVLGIQGSTLNFMTNFSMILALGILVDTAVVIVEGIHHHILKGHSPLEAAKMSLVEFRGPLISGTLTTLAVFIPLFSLPGVLGKYLSFVPITVFIVLTSALTISLLLIPAYGSRLMISRKQEEKNEKNTNQIRHIAHVFRQKFVAIETAVIQKYSNVLEKFLKTRWKRIGLFYTVLVAFFLSFTLPIKFELFPSGDAFSFNLTLERPEGTISEETQNYALPIKEHILKIPEVRHISTTIDGKQASFYVELLTEQERKDQGLRTSKAIVDNLQIEMKEKFADPTGSSIRLQNAQNGPPSAFPVGVRVVATDSNSISIAEEVAQDITEILKGIPNTFGVRNDIEMIPGEFLYRVDRERAIALGVDPDTVASTVRTAINGSTAATITRGARDVDIVVQYNDSVQDSINEIDNLRILNQNGESILLKQVTNKQLTSGLSSIRRRDTQIAFTVSSLLTESGNAAEVTTELFNRLENYQLPSGVEIINAGENEENAALFAALLSAFLVALLMMFLILVIQFNSYSQPLLILTTILFAQIGVGIGLSITGTPRSLAFILGAISLAGIVVNDAIIMIDQMNKNRDRERGKKRLIESISAAGRFRFVPVLLTTLTTSAGIIPLVFVDVFWAGLSYTIVFGLTMATFLTLFVTPVMYYQLEREKFITFVPLLMLGLVGGIFTVSKQIITDSFTLDKFGIVVVLFLFLSWLVKKMPQKYQASVEAEQERFAKRHTPQPEPPKNISQQVNPNLDTQEQNEQPPSPDSTQNIPPDLSDRPIRDVKFRFK